MVQKTRNYTVLSEQSRARPRNTLTAPLHNTMAETSADADMEMEDLNQLVHIVY